MSDFQTKIDAMVKRVSDAHAIDHDAKQAPITNAQITMKPVTDFLANLARGLKQNYPRLAIVPNTAGWFIADAPNRIVGIIYELTLGYEVELNMTFRVQGDTISYHGAVARPPEYYGPDKREELFDAIVTDIEKLLLKRAPG